jgi:hypothetical protein
MHDITSRRSTMNSSVEHRPRLLGKTLDPPLKFGQGVLRSNGKRSDRFCIVRLPSKWKEYMPLGPAALLGYIALLSLLATTSPGNGLLGWGLVILPTPVLDSLHAPAYGLLAWLGISWLQKREWPQPLAMAAGSSFALVFGAWTETLQVSTPGRGLEVKDLLTDGVGIAVAVLMVLRHSMPMQRLTEPTQDNHVSPSHWRIPA